MTGHLPDASAATLGWLEPFLCPPGSGLHLAVRGDGDGHRTGGWVMVPPGRPPRLLSPVRGRAATSALSQFNDSMTQGARLRKWAMGMALQAGAGMALRRQQVSIAGRSSDPQLDLLGTVLPEAFGGPVVTAVMLGRELRPNTKPVIQIMRHDGRVLAYAKLGWNPLTKALISNEAAALSSWADEPPLTFSVPRSLGIIAWNDLSILLVSPVPHRVFRRGPRDQSPRAEIVREVFEHGGTAEGPILSAPLTRRLVDQAEGAVDEHIRRVALEAVDRTVEELGDRTVRWGTAHGDWGPWNMSRTRETLHVWDWERMATGVPVGFDVLHFCFQTRALRSDGRVDRAVTASLAAAEGRLLGIGVERSLHASLMTLYLTETMLRLEAGRASGVPVREALVRGLVDVLSSGAVLA